MYPAFFFVLEVFVCMKCRKCKAEIPDTSKYCMVCGARQDVQRAAKTRGNGQGTAIKRGNTWTAVWTEGFSLDHSCERKVRQKRKWKGGFKTKREALAYAANPVAEQRDFTSLESYWLGWEATDCQDLSKSKQTAFRIAWRKLSSLADRDVMGLTIHDLQSVVDEQAPTYYTAKDMKTLLSHLYKRAVAEGNARTNLAEFIRLPPLEEKEMQPFSEEELKKLWADYASGDKFIGFVLLMVYTGMMPGELLGMKKDMADFEKSRIIGCGLKTKKRKETPIVFPDVIHPVLRTMIESSASKEGYVVGMNRDNFYSEYHAALKRAGVRDLPPYSCRHTTATALAMGNIAPSVIKEVMRHTNFSTTQRYIHPDSEDALEAVNTLQTANYNANNT